MPAFANSGVFTSYTINNATLYSVSNVFANSASTISNVSVGAVYTVNSINSATAGLSQGKENKRQIWS